MTMASPLKRVNLMLDEKLLGRLRREARRHHVSMSEMARTLLGRQLGQSRQPSEALERLRRLRESFGAMPDCTEIIRRGRDRGW
jgi:hypothetical protein